MMHLLCIPSLEYWIRATTAVYENLLCRSLHQLFFAVVACTYNVMYEYLYWLEITNLLGRTFNECLGDKSYVPPLTWVSKSRTVHCSVNVIVGIKGSSSTFGIIFHFGPSSRSGRSLMVGIRIWESSFCTYVPLFSPMYAKSGKEGGDNLYSYQ